MILPVWLQRLLLVTLSTLLSLQGKYAKLKTPVLPEPRGDREGITGNGAPLRVLIAGDSAAAGVGVELQANALAGQIAAQLSSTHRVNWRLIAKTGLTTKELHTLLQTEDEHAARLVQQPVFDVVVLSLGVNDITSGILAAHWIEQQRQLLQWLKTQWRAKLIVIAELPPMHEFTALPQPLRFMLGQRAKRFTALLRHESTNWDGCVLLTPQVEPMPEALASDGFHPGRYTYARWAKEAVRLIRLHHSMASPL